MHVFYLSSTSVNLSCYSYPMNFFNVHSPEDVTLRLTTSFDMSIELQYYTLCARIKPGFHYPSSWVELTRVHFLTPELTARVDWCQKMHPS